ncbi:hypothetical protein [Nonomuraea endophytica]|uniref:Uncharacterized protein n=1 Tax=Nonomuraea endophytica TaxID=714136 RepID=A0A7W8A971_9ACTN|nr:hypothetical protein [Nonomuraea endophytica]MBB5081334.1 hypothetical protein [Nonomuraea endophytica]
MIPTGRELSLCGLCREPILWTVTEAGNRLAVDPNPAATGNTACYRTGPRAWKSRALHGVEALPRQPWEDVFMPHVATCARANPVQTELPAVLPPNVVRLDLARQRRALKGARRNATR